MIQTLLLLSAALTGVQSSEEADYYTVEFLPLPEGEVLEVGGLDLDEDGTLYASTRRGQVWRLRHVLEADLSKVRTDLIAEGLQEGLGLDVRSNGLHVLQRGALVRLADLDGDDYCETTIQLTDEWGLSGNYHEFAFGLPGTPQDGYFIGLNVGFFEADWWLGQSVVPYRGWVLRYIERNGRSMVEPFACGFRSPCGLSLDPNGELFVTDNQGDWVAASPVFHVQKDKFYGHPSSLRWREDYLATATLPSKTEPPNVDRAPAALWLPYDWSRSPGNLVFDTTGGVLGPFPGQMFIAELTNGMIVRASLEEVQGVQQGACFVFRRNVGSAARLALAPNGTLFAGLTNRGWGGLPPGDGIARVRWTGRVPLEMSHVSVRNDGFVIDLTLPLAEGSPLDPATFVLREYDYDYWWEYGSPERASRRLEVERVELSEDRFQLRLFTEPLVAGKVVRGKLPALSTAGGDGLLHNEFAYTINQLPDGPFSTEHVVKVVPPPPARESQEQGWLRLTYGDAVDAWNSTGWELCNAQLDLDDPTRFQITEGNNALVNVATDASPYVSRSVFGDCVMEVRFMLPQDGALRVSFLDQYAIDLFGRVDQAGPTEASCGALAAAGDFPGRAPDWSVFSQPGAWHEMLVEFHASREGAPARFGFVEIDGHRLHDDIELAGAPLREGPGPISFEVLAGQAAFGAVQLKLLEPPHEPPMEDGWVSLFPDEELEGWTITGDADWEFDNDVLVGSGKPGALVSPRDDYVDFEVRGRVKVSDGGNSGLFLRANVTDGQVSGYEAEVNCSYPDSARTGSITDLAPVKVQLIPPNTWFDYALTVRDDESGTRLTVALNGVVVNEVTDTERRFRRGAIVLEQHHSGSTIEFEDLEVREL